MYYEINIALNGKHFFATHKRSITDFETFLKVFSTLNEKFPEKEGYSLSAEYNPERSLVTFRETILEHIKTGTQQDIFELGEDK